jgi:protein required for attachment to host cells
MRPKRTWILIADGHRAKVFESQGRSSELVPVEDLSMEMDLPPNRDLQEDRPGRSFESSSPTRHAVESRTDPHRELKRDLARAVSEKLERALRGQRFDRLCVVAPPSTLGDLRRVLSAPVLERVTAEIAKDLVNVPHHDLPGHLEEIWSSR